MRITGCGARACAAALPALQGQATASAWRYRRAGACLPGTRLFVSSAAARKTVRTIRNLARCKPIDLVRDFWRVRIGRDHITEILFICKHLKRYFWKADSNFKFKSCHTGISHVSKMGTRKRKVVLFLIKRHNGSTCIFQVCHITNMVPKNGCAGVGKNTYFFDQLLILQFFISHRQNFKMQCFCRIEPHCCADFQKLNFIQKKKKCQKLRGSIGCMDVARFD